MSQKSAIQIKDDVCRQVGRQDKAAPNARHLGIALGETGRGLITLIANEKERAGALLTAIGASRQGG